MNTATLPTTLPGPDTLRLAGRFVWKECRMLSGLALGAGGIAVLVMLAALATVDANAAARALVSVAVGATALFSIAATVTLFAVEREEGTTRFLQVLPDNQRAMVLGKLAGAALMVLLFGLALAVVAAAFSRGEAVGVLASAGLAYFALVLVVGTFAWGLLASLLVRHPLLAACAAIAAASLATFLTIAAATGNVRDFSLDDPRALSTRLLVSLLVLALGVGLGLDWLPRGQQRSRERSLARARRQPRETADAAPRVGWLGSYGRLVWQTHRESWRAALAALVVGGALSVGWPLVVGMSFGMGSLAGEKAIYALLTGLLFTPAVFGALVFRADQRRQSYRFLATHAAPPRRVWLARHTVWLGYLSGLALVVAAVLLLACYLLLQRLGVGAPLYEVQTNVSTIDLLLPYATISEATRQFGWGATGALAAGFVAYACGQLFSLALRSEILAGMLALGCSVLVAAWTLQMHAWRMPPTWFVLPIGLGLMAATLLRMPAWLAERRGVGGWVGPAATALAPALLVLCWIPGERQEQLAWPIRSVNLSKAQLRRMSRWADEARQEQSRGRDAADAYARLASEGLPDGGASGDWAAEFIRLSKIDCRLPAETQQGGARGNALDFLWGVAIDRGRSDGDIELLLACRRQDIQRFRSQFLVDRRSWSPLQSGLGMELVSWAAAPGRSSSDVIDAVDQLRALNLPLNTPSDPLWNDYLHAAEVLAGRQTPRFLASADNKAGHSPPLAQWRPYLLHQLPGESARAERALKIMAFWQLDYLAACLHQANGPYSAHGRSLLQNAAYNFPHDHVQMMAGAASVQQHNLVETVRNMALVQDAMTSELAAEEFNTHTWLGSHCHDWLAGYAESRAELVRLALIAYHHDHGRYPQTLDALEPDYLAGPLDLVDPCHGEPFGYAPEGLASVATAWSAPQGGYAAGTPLLWGGGTHQLVPREHREMFEFDAQGARVRRNSLHEDELEDLPEGHTIREIAAVRLEARPGERSYDAFWAPLPVMDAPASGSAESADPQP